MIMHRHLAAATLAVAVASPAMALEAHKSVMVDGTPEQAWATIGDFCGIAGWHPRLRSASSARRTAADPHPVAQGWWHDRRGGDRTRQEQLQLHDPLGPTPS